MPEKTAGGLPVAPGVHSARASMMEISLFLAGMAATPPPSVMWASAAHASAQTRASHLPPTVSHCRVTRRRLRERPFEFNLDPIGRLPIEVAFQCRKIDELGKLVDGTTQRNVRKVLATQLFDADAAKLD